MMGHKICLVETVLMMGHKICLVETVLMMGHKICFYGEIWLIIPKPSTTRKQTTKFSSANFQKMLSPRYIILRIQRLEGKQCISR